MIRLTQVKLHTKHTKEELEEKIRKLLRLSLETSFSYEINRRSLDARKKPALFYTYTIDVSLSKEKDVLRRAKQSGAFLYEPVSYQFPHPGEKTVNPRPVISRPVIVGTGPAGLFCGYMLALAGYRPLLLERGADVDRRLLDVQEFWETGKLLENSNVQFGEGGAGTFSDGKLNTLIKDKSGRNRQVLKTFVSCGAPEEILYDKKPHMGTDMLIHVVKNMRKKIEALGGQVRFNACVTDVYTTEDKICGIEINGKERLACDILVLAIGHSARDTFVTLQKRGIPMESKEFAAGFRVEHIQRHIDMVQYGRCDRKELPAASYKLTFRTKDNRGVYSFCMCPGGYVVNASSEPGLLAINGMSYSGRDSQNANSAIVVSVKKEDFEAFSTEGPLAGMAFQRQLEKQAYQAGAGKIPIQRYGDLKQAFERFEKNSGAKTFQKSKETFQEPKEILSDILPCMKGRYVFADLSRVLPEHMTKAFLQGMEHFEHVIPGFAAEEVLVSAVESRTSSPVRILRAENGESEKKGLYPCGEGAGYAGGIMSAAMDGIRTAEKIAGVFLPAEE